MSHGRDTLESMFVYLVKVGGIIGHRVSALNAVGQVFFEMEHPVFSPMYCCWENY